MGPQEPTNRAAYLLSATLHTLYFGPRRALQVHLAGLKDILEFNGTPVASALDNLPKDPKTVISALHLDPVVHAYVSCPTCYTLYPYDRSDGGAQSCTHRETETSPVCGTPLSTLR